MIKPVLAALLLAFLPAVAGAEDSVTVLTPDKISKITKLVAEGLEDNHFSQEPLDDAIAQKFLQAYLDMLDYNHLIFNQSDIDALRQQYGTTLDDLTAKGDASPAFIIFKLFLQRLDQREALVEKILGDKFDFTKDESYKPDHSKDPWPKDDAEAEVFWRQRIKDELLTARLNKTKPDEALNRVKRRYVRMVKNMKELTDEDILENYLTALAHAYDPHSSYMSDKSYKEFESDIISLQFSGIGAELSTDDGYAKIVRLLPGGPADLDKHLQPNDKIVAVAQEKAEPVDAVDMTLKKVVSMIRGARGTKVTLTIIPAAAPDTRKDIVLVRDDIKQTDKEAKVRIIERKMSDGQVQRIGVIDLPEFYQHCASARSRLRGDDSDGPGDIEILIDALKKQNVGGIILDLRNNGGGLLDEAIELTGLFIKQGPVVQLRDTGRPAKVAGDTNDKMIWDGPLEVLTSRLTASASEIVAAALQDYDRAIIVGDQSTHGKGTVQNPKGLGNDTLSFFHNDYGQLKVTIGKFYRISGGSTQLKGVIPDIILPSVLDEADIGESSLPNALPYDEVPPATYDKMGMVSPYLDVLRKQSMARIPASPEFKYVLEDIAYWKKQKENKTVFLQEAERLKEKNDLAAKVKQRDAERLARKSSQDGVLELTLAMIQGNQAPTPWKPIVRAKPFSNNDGEDDDDDVSSPDVILDAQMQEGINILYDYIAIFRKTRGQVVAEKAGD